MEKYQSNVREYREKRHITQQELADAVEISRRTLCDIELGEANPRLGTMLRLASYFEVTLDVLFWQEVNYR